MEGEVLFGRDEEAEDIADLLIAERLVLLHSPSGAGKTSLIQAKVLGALKEAGFMVLPIARVSLPPVLPRGNGREPNRFVLSVLHSWEERRTPEADTRPRMELEELAALTIPEYLARLTPDRGKTRVVLVFDQFEELVTLVQGDPEVAARSEFLAQLTQSLEDRSRWALFAMREDSLAAVESLVCGLPTRLRHRYRLDLLDEGGALEAIRKPTGQIEFTEEAAKQLFDDLRSVAAPTRGVPEDAEGPAAEAMKGPYVEPVQLQVVCYELWERLPIWTRKITVKDLGGHIDIDGALANYYTRRLGMAVNACEQEQELRGTVSEWGIRRWIDAHLIRRGRRAQLPEVAEEVRLLPEPARKELLAGHIMRREEYRNVAWYELSHDRLVRPIQRSNEDYYAEHASVLQRRVDAWVRRPSRDSLLIHQNELTEAECWVKAHPALVDDDTRNFLAASEQAVRARARTHRLTILAAAAAGIVFFSAFWWGTTKLSQHVDREEALSESLFVALKRADTVALFRPFVLRYFGYADTALTDSVAQRRFRESLRANALLVRNARTTDTTARANVVVQYFRKPGDPQGVEQAIQQLGFRVATIRPQTATPNNTVLFGSQVSAQNVEALTLALVRAGIPVRRIGCFRNAETARRTMIQVLGASAATHDPVIPLTSVGEAARRAVAQPSAESQCRRPR
jgi:hypothetical protein